MVRRAASGLQDCSGARTLPVEGVSQPHPIRLKGERLEHIGEAGVLLNGGQACLGMQCGTLLLGCEGVHETRPQPSAQAAHCLPPWAAAANCDGGQRPAMQRGRGGCSPPSWVHKSSCQDHQPAHRMWRAGAGRRLCRVRLTHCTSASASQCTWRHGGRWLSLGQRWCALRAV